MISLIGKVKMVIQLAGTRYKSLNPFFLDLSFYMNSLFEQWYAEVKSFEIWCQKSSYWDFTSQNKPFEEYQKYYHYQCWGHNCAYTLDGISYYTCTKIVKTYTAYVINQENVRERRITWPNTVIKWVLAQVEMNV